MMNKRIIIIALFAFLSACGGGGGGDDNTDNTTPVADNTGDSSPDSSIDGGVTDAGTGGINTDDAAADDSVDDNTGIDSTDDDQTDSTDNTTDDQTDSTDNTTDGSGPMVDNALPVISSLASDVGIVMIQEAVNFTWSVADFDIDDTLMCSLDTDSDGTPEYTFDDCEAITSVTHRYRFPGEYQALLTVSDGNGGAAAQSTGMTVLPLAVKFSTTSPVRTGEQSEFKISVSNVALVPVNNVNVLFRVPAGLGFHPVFDAQPNTDCGTCGEGREAGWSWPTLAPGESRTIAVNALVLDSVVPGSQIDLLADVTADNMAATISVPQTWNTSNSQSAEITVDAETDALTAGSSTLVSLDIGNISTGNISNTQLRLDVPVDAAFISSSNGGVFNAETQQIVWDLGELPVQQARRVIAQIGTSNEAVPGQSFLLQAELSLDGSDTIDVVAEHVFTVSGNESPLQVAITAVDAPVAATGRHLFEFTIGNVGLVPSNNVTLLTRVPPELDFHSAFDAYPNTDCGTCDAGREASWEFSSIAAGETRTIVVNSPVLSIVPAGSLIRLPVTVSADGMLDEIDRVKTVPVGSMPLSSLGISSQNDSVQAGDQIFLNLTVGNISNGNLSNAQLILTDSFGSDPLNFTLGEVPVLGSSEVTATITVPGSVVPGQVLEFRAELTHDQGALVDAVAEYAITVSENASPLQVELSSSESISAGERLGYNFTLTNTGLVPLNNVLVLYRVPDQLDFHPVFDAEPDTDCGTCDGGREATWEYDSIPAGEQRLITLDAPVLADVRSGTLIESRLRVIADGVRDVISVSDVVPVR